MAVWQRINQPWSYDVGSSESDCSYISNSPYSTQNLSINSTGFDGDSTTVQFSDGVTTIFGHGNNTFSVVHSNNNTAIDGNGSSYLQVVGGTNNVLVLENGADIVNNIGAESTFLVTLGITYGYKAIFSDRQVGLCLDENEYHVNVTQGTDVFTHIYDRYTGAEKATLQFVNGAYNQPYIWGGCGEPAESDEIVPETEPVTNGYECENTWGDEIHDETYDWCNADTPWYDEITAEPEPTVGGFVEDSSPSLNVFTPGGEATVAEPGNYYSSTPNYGVATNPW